MSQKNLISLLILFPLVYCINEYNPYKDPSNADVIVVSQSFPPNDSLPIFCTETISVKVAFAELVESFTVSADNNRLWQDTTIIHNAFSDEHHFSFSFFDTGYQAITITTTPYEGDPKEKRIRIYCYSPLHQDTINGFGPYSDSVIVNASPVKDIDVEYFWQFDDTVINSFRTIDTFVISQFIAPEGTGKLWVQDPLGLRSPSVTFYYSLKDLRPPVIYCVNEDFILADTILSGIDLFAFKVKIEDRLHDGIDSISFNGEDFDYKSGDNIYTKLYDSMAQYEETPLNVTVYASDKNGNDTAKSFYLFYDTTSNQTNKVTISLNTVDQTGFTTTTKKVSVIGEAVSKLPTSYTLKFFLNDTYLTGCDTVLYYQGLWGCILNLQENRVNEFNIYALSSENDTLGRLSVDIIHTNVIQDTTGPVISRIYIDNSHYTKDMFVSNNAPELLVYALDLVSGIQKVFINKIAAKPDSKYLGWHAKVSLHHGRNSLPLLLYDFEGNITRDTLQIFFNRIPTLVVTPSFPAYLKTGYTYTDTFEARDADGDSIALLQTATIPNLDIIAEKSGIITRFFAAWKPQENDTGSVNFSFRLYDRLQYSAVSSWVYTITADTIIDNPVQFLTTTDDIENLLVACGTSLLDTLQVKSGTGTPPYSFSAQRFPEGAWMLQDTASPIFNWSPSKQDTGTHLIVFTVFDLLRTSDTLFHTVTVIPENNSPCSLAVEDISGKNLLSGTHMTLSSRTDTGQLLFTVIDTDHPLSEHFTITKKLSNTVTTFDTDSNWFYINIIPILNKDPDTLRIHVQDKTAGSSGDSMAISIEHPQGVNPDEINGLYLWLQGEDEHNIAVDPTNNNVLYWASSHNSQMYLTSDSHFPNYKKLSTPPHLEFNRSEGDMLASKFTPANTSYTMFFVTRLFDFSSKRYTLMSFADHQNGYFYFGTDGSLLKAFYTDPSNTTISFTSGSLRMVEGRWHIITFAWDRPNSSSIIQRLDGKNGNQASTNNNLQPPKEILLGAYGETDYDLYGFWNGDIAEGVVYNRALSTSEMENIENYLSAKFGIPLQK